MKCKMWTQEEEKILKGKYVELGSKCVTLLPGRNIKMITNKASRLGLHHKTCNWSRIEIKILTENFPKMGGFCARLLPGRTYKMISGKAKRLFLSGSELIFNTKDDPFYSETDSMEFLQNFRNKKNIISYDCGYNFARGVDNI